MGKIKHYLGQVLLWKYDRGQLAYDIIVALILLFIFLVPKSCFERKKQAPPPQKTEIMRVQSNKL